MITDKIRKKMNEFLNGGHADEQIERVTSEEMEKAIKEVRPEIAELCKTSVRDAMDSLKASPCVFDKDRLTKILNQELEDAIGVYDDEIEHAMAEVLINELKTCSILSKA